MKVAVVHEWLDNYAGSERVLEQILYLYPDADLFAVCDFLSDNDRFFIQGKKARTTFIQRLPFAKKHFRNYLALMPLAIEQLDLSSYNLIISCSHAVSKGVITGPNQLHVSYVHSPIRYAWDLQHQYLKETGLNRGLKGLLVRYVLHKIRNWDFRAAAGVDVYISNSNYIGKRIRKFYRRESTTIYPPVNISDFTLKEDKEDFYFTASRLVPYKKVDLIVNAFNKMPDKKLVVIGDGSEMKRIRAIANDNIELLGYQSFEVLRDYMQRSKAFVFAAEEDFGIVPVEAQACGTPVIAFGQGGALETVIGLESPYPTGVFFNTQTVDDLINTVNVFELEYERFSPKNCRQNAVRFSPERFREELRLFIEQSYNEFLNNSKKVNSDGL